VPYGLDALYYSVPLTQAKANIAPLRESTVKALARLSLDRDEAELLFPLYVTALCARFLPDSLTEHGQQLRPRVAALLDLLERLLETGATRAAPVAPTTRGADQIRASPEKVRR
jgi:hypothetical protein